MTLFRSAIVFSLMASVSPLAAQTALNERPGLWISVRPATPQDVPEVLSAPEAAPLIASEQTGGVLLDVTGDAAGVILSHPDLEETLAQRPDATTPRPRPRPYELVAALPEASGQVGTRAVLVDAAFTGPRPSQRPRLVPEPEAPVAPELGVQDPLQEAEAVPDTAVALAELPVQPDQASDEVVPLDAAALAEALAAQLVGEAHEIMAAAPLQTREPVGDAPQALVVTAAPALTSGGQAEQLAPTPFVFQAVTRIAPRNQPAALSAVLLPGQQSGARPAVQPAAFLMPREDTAPVLSRPLPEGPDALEGVAAPDLPQTAPLSAALLPGAMAAPSRAGGVAIAVQPALDPFPYSALPPGNLPEGPAAQDRMRGPQSPVPEAMAAVLMTEPRPAPAPLAPLALPEMPHADPLPADPDVAPELPVPDIAALERMIAEAAICWQFASLSPEAGWASLSVEVALDEMNMPAANSIRLTGFAHVLSSSAAEAYRAAQNALVACAEASDGQPATRAVSLAFDRDGVRLR